MIKTKEILGCYIYSASKLWHGIVLIRGLIDTIHIIDPIVNIK